MTTIHSIASGSARLATTVAGAGDTIIFLHAGVADRRMGQPQLDAFAAGHRVVAYDRRGFGETTYTPELFSHLEDLRAVHVATTAEPTTLVGCSMGGGLAIDYALAHPAAVGALVLVGSAVSGAPYTPSKGAVAKLEAEIEAAERVGDLERLNHLEAHAWLDGPESVEGRVGGELRELFLDMNGRALRAEPPGDHGRPVDSYGRLAEIVIPTLIVVGTLDFPDILDLSRHLRETIPGVSYVEIPGTAHLPSLEQPEAFNGLLAAFLERLRPAGSPAGASLGRAGDEGPRLGEARPAARDGPRRRVSRYRWPANFPRRPDVANTPSQARRRKLGGTEPWRTAQCSLSPH